MGDNRKEHVHMFYKKLLNATIISSCSELNNNMKYRKVKLDLTSVVTWS